MIRNIVLATILAIVVAAIGPGATAQLSTQTDYQSVFARAAERADLRTLSSLPFVLQIRFELLDGPHWILGTYTRTWLAQDKWREEVTVGTYHRIEFGGTNGFWRIRSAASEPHVIRILDRLISTTLIIKQHSEFTVTGTSQEELAGNTYTVVSGRWMGSAVWKYYFDVSTGELRRSQQGALDFEYSDFRPVLNKWFPSKMRASQGGVLLVKVITGHVGTASAHPNDFMPPRDAVFFGACEEMRWPEPKVKPEFKTSVAPPPGVSVIVTAIIDAQGNVKNLAVARSSGSTQLDGIAVENARKLHFQPAMCGGTAVAREIEFPIFLTR
jgi:TonB family protein